MLSSDRRDPFLFGRSTPSSVGAGAAKARLFGLPRPTYHGSSSAPGLGRATVMILSPGPEAYYPEEPWTALHPPLCRCAGLDVHKKGGIRWRAVGYRSAGAGIRETQSRIVTSRNSRRTCRPSEPLHRCLGTTSFFGRRARAVENNENVRFT